MPGANAARLLLRSPGVRIESEELQKRRMSGVFDADDPSPLMQFLERDPAVEVAKSDDEFVIRGR